MYYMYFVCVYMHTSVDIYDKTGCRHLMWVSVPRETRRGGWLETSVGFEYGRSVGWLGREDGWGGCRERPLWVLTALIRGMPAALSAGMMSQNTRLHSALCMCPKICFYTPYYTNDYFCPKIRGDSRSEIAREREKGSECEPERASERASE